MIPKFKLVAKISEPPTLRGAGRTHCSTKGGNTREMLVQFDLVYDEIDCRVWWKGRVYEVFQQRGLSLIRYQTDWGEFSALLRNQLHTTVSSLSRVCVAHHARNYEASGVAHGGR